MPLYVNYGDNIEAYKTGWDYFRNRDKAYKVAESGGWMSFKSIRHATKDTGPKKLFPELRSGYYVTNWKLESLITLSKLVGLGRVTDGNIDEWEYRIALYQKVQGAFLTTSKKIRGKDGYTTVPFEYPEGLVENFVGFSTNWGTGWTRKQFHKNLMEAYSEEHERKQKQELKEVA